MYDLHKLIKSLCDARRITIYRLCKDTGIQPSVITDLKMGRQSGLSAKNMNKIAEYFDVTVGYLLGETGNPVSPDIKKSSPEKEDDITFDDFTYAMHNEGKELNEAEKEMLLDMARVLKAKHKERDRNGQADKPV